MLTRRMPHLNRRLVMLFAAAVLALITLFVPAQTSLAAPAAGESRTAKPTIVLVHGAWADSSSWSRVIRLLQRQGYTVVAAPNPLRGLSSDADHLSAFIRQRTTGPVVLVGHSYGGAVITEAALTDPTVKALVYVDAFAPAEGESVLGLQSSVPGAGDPSSLFDPVVYPGAPEGDADLYLKTPAFTDAFATGLPRKTAIELAATQRPITLHALTEPAGPPAWEKLPSWYVLGTQDRIIAPSLQLRMAQRAHSDITRVKAGHLSLVTRPASVASVIRTAARHVSHR